MINDEALSGHAPFAPDSDYKSNQVFRNVKDYGAVGDGKTNDTEAINRAVSDGNRCGADCGSSTTTLIQSSTKSRADRLLSFQASNKQDVGSLVLVDALIANTENGIVTTLQSHNATSILLQNVGSFNVKTAVKDKTSNQVLVAGGNEVFLDSWGFGLFARRHQRAVDLCQRGNYTYHGLPQGASGQILVGAF